MKRSKPRFCIDSAPGLYVVLLPILACLVVPLWDGTIRGWEVLLFFVGACLLTIIAILTVMIILIKRIP